jgi:hypothetical protein
MPSAFVVSNSPVTASGNITVTGAGTVSQYIRGDGSLADFPQSGGGGGASVNYYLNGSVSQGTIGGIAYYEMNRTPILGAGTDFTIAADGYIASFITDAGNPGLLEIPGGNWNLETYFAASSGGGSPSFYVELYKVNSGGTATLVASNSANPELIAFGTTTTAYFSSLAVPTTVLTLTDRLALRYYVTHGGRTITMHTENSNLCQIITTFTTGLTALNGLTAQVQNFATGTTGTDFNISSSVSTHTFNIPSASATARGLITTGSQTIAGSKTFSDDAVINGVNVGRGGSNIQTNTRVGSASLQNATSGGLNTAFGFSSLSTNTSGEQNTGIGGNSLNKNITGNYNTSVGSNSLIENTTGNFNTAIGSNSGRYIQDGSSANSTGSNSIFIGFDTKALANNQTNQIVIGHNAIGNGSNTVTIGNSSITENYFTGNIRGGAFIRTGGTSSQFLKADGSVDSSTYLTTGSAASTYLPLVGGTLTGTLEMGTTAPSIFLRGANSGLKSIQYANSGGSIHWSVQTSFGSAGEHQPFSIRNGVLGTDAIFIQPASNNISFTGSLSSATDVSGARLIASSGANTMLMHPNIMGTNRLEAGGALPLALVSAQAITLAAGGTTPQITLSTGGAVTLTGALNGTSASFTGDVTASSNAFFGTFNGNDKYHFEPFTNAAGGANNAYFVSGKIDNNERSGFVFQARNSNGEEYNAIIVEGHNSTSTTTPLSIASTGAATFSSSVAANGVMSLGNDGTFGSTYKTLGLTGNTTGSHRIFAGTADDMYFAAATGRGFEFRVNGGGVGNLNINSNGNVGIGTPSPYALLSVYSGTAGDRILIDSSTGSGSNGSIAWGAGGTPNISARIKGTDDGFFGTHLIFETRGSSGPALNTFERMRIRSDGQVQPGADNSYGLGGSGIRWANVWAANGTIQTSDEREKKDIIDSDLGLDFVNQLRPVSFKWKVGQNVVTSEVVKDEEGNPVLDDQGNEKTETIITPREGKRTHYGLIAQEVEELLDGKDFGGFIHDDETDIKGLRYDQFVPVLIKAIQELKAEIESLKSQING